VTIHKNESAMVPILQQELPAEHVTLWSANGRSPLRAVWLENTSKLTLNEGSFSIFESGEFAGEGLLDPIHPGEKRLLSYAADQAVRGKQTLTHVKIAKGVVVETHNDVASETYAATNAADVDRVVLIEQARQWIGVGAGRWAHCCRDLAQSVSLQASRGGTCDGHARSTRAWAGNDHCAFERRRRPDRLFARSC
jgi:hypothetical protein